MGNPVFQFAHRFDQVSGSAIREIFKVIAQPGMISFAGGNPSPDALPDDIVRELSNEVLREKGKVQLITYVNEQTFNKRSISFRRSVLQQHFSFFTQHFI